MAKMHLPRAILVAAVLLPLRPMIGADGLTSTPVAAKAVLKGPTWSDGIAEYDRVLPTAGYLIPAEVMRRDGIHATSPDRLIATSRKMTADELRRISGGGPPLITAETPLLIFPNQGYNVALWTGRPLKSQSITPAFWNGRNWASSGTDPQGESREILFQAPNATAEVAVLLGCATYSPTLETREVFFGKFPDPDDVIPKGIDSSDIVVHVVAPPDRPGPLLDCRKGMMTRDQFQKAVPPGVGSDSSFVFFDGPADRATFRFAARDRLHYVNRYGRLDMAFSSDQDFRRFAGSRKRVWDLRAEPINWLLARQAAGPDQAGRMCTLRVVNPGAPAGDWTILELTAGRDEPAGFYTPSMTASQRDGGEPLLAFEVTTPDGSFDLIAPSRERAYLRGHVAAQSVGPPQVGDPGIDYRFIDCGPGVMKLAIRPRRVPWSGEIRGRLGPPPARFAGGGGGMAGGPRGMGATMPPAPKPAAAGGMGMSGMMGGGMGGANPQGQPVSIPQPERSPTVRLRFP